MSFAGLKKQFNKTSQFLSERVGGNKGSEIDEEIVELSRKLDVVGECVENMQTRTKEYLQPNPTARTKLAVLASCQKVRGQVSMNKYPQPEMNLGDVFWKGGEGLADSKPYSASLTELGSAFKGLADVKDGMEEQVKQVFLVPLFEAQQKDLREITNHRKKMESRRLDYDYKKNKGAKESAEVVQAAEDKFYESKQLCYDSMLNFMENDVEQITQLHAFSQVIFDYHKQCTDVMGTLTEVLSKKLSEASSQTREKRIVIHQSSSENNNEYDTLSNGKRSSRTNSFAPPVPAALPATPQRPSCRALYDFDAENEGELAFAKGEMIEIKSRVDENWLEGSCNGKYGFFPENFVEIVVPI